MNRPLLAAFLLLAALAIVSGARTGAAQSPGPGLTIPQVITENGSTQVRAVVSVVGANERPVTGLTAFSAEVDGKAVPASARSVLEAEPIAVLLAIDISGSMAGEPLDQAKAAALAFLASLQPDDFGSVIAFNTTVQPSAPFTTDRQLLGSAINGLSASGDTALYDAVASAVYVASAAPVPRRAVVILTDGEDTKSSVTSAESISRAVASSLPVFTIGLGPADAAYLTSLANATGGRYAPAPAPADVPGVYGALSELLRGQYELTLDLAGFNDGDHTLKVTAQAAAATISGSTSFRLGPGSVLPTAVPATPQVPRDRESSSGGLPAVAYLALAAAALVIFGGGGYVWVRRRRPVVAAVGEPVSRRVTPLRPAEAPHVQAPSARLRVLAGPAAGQEIVLGTEPLTIGSDGSCGLQLAPETMVAPQQARVWLREGHFMIHHLGRQRPTLVGDRAVEWAVLEPGDEIILGANRLRFELTNGH